MKKSKIEPFETLTYIGIALLVIGLFAFFAACAIVCDIEYYPNLKNLQSILIAVFGVCFCGSLICLAISSKLG